MPVPKNSPPLPRVNLADAVYERVLQEVVTGRWAPGDKISESLITAATGVSRMPVREALSRLARIGVVDVRQGRRTVVSPLSAHHQHAAVELLHAITMGSLRLLAAADSAIALRGLSTRLRAVASAADLFADNGPLDFIVQHCGNPRVRSTWDRTISLVQRYWNLLPDEDFPLEIDPTVCDGIRAGAPDAIATFDQLVEQCVRRVQPTDPEPEQVPAIDTDDEDIARTLMWEHAFTTIRDEIRAGSFEPGETLDEEELATWLSMSRWPTRQALLELAEHGLIDFEPGQAPRIANLDSRRTNQLLIVSAFINEYAIDRIEHLPTSTRIALDDMTAAIEAAHAASNLSQLAFDVGRFYRLLVELLGNPAMLAEAARIDVEATHLLTPGGSSIDPDALATEINRMNNAAQSDDIVELRRVLHAANEPTFRNFLTQRDH